MQRVQFEKGKQREFLKKVILESGAPSLRRLNQFGFDIPYSTWKNYFVEVRHLPKDLFLELCQLIRINPNEMDIKFLPSNFGQVKGGKISKKDLNIRNN